MKKYIALLLALVMVFALAACGSKEETPAPAGSEEAAAPAETTEDVKVAMITDYGDITDQSFNQTTYEACKAFCEKNAVDFKYYKPTDDSTAARVEMIDQLRVCRRHRRDPGPLSRCEVCRSGRVRV